MNGSWQLASEVEDCFGAFRGREPFGGRGEMEQIQFLLGHVSVQTTEKYLGCKQRLRGAVNDRIGIEPAP